MLKKDTFFGPGVEELISHDIPLVYKRANYKNLQGTQVSLNTRLQLQDDSAVYTAKHQIIDSGSLT